jgi:hypothetical protein
MCSCGRDSKPHTEACHAAHRRVAARRNPLRVGTHAYDYVGYAPRPEQAAALNEMRRRFRDRQNES